MSCNRTLAIQRPRFKSSRLETVVSSEAHGLQKIYVVWSDGALWKNAVIEIDMTMLQMTISKGMFLCSNPLKISVLNFQFDFHKPVRLKQNLWQNQLHNYKTKHCLQHLLAAIKHTRKLSKTRAIVNDCPKMQSRKFQLVLQGIQDFSISDQFQENINTL